MLRRREIFLCCLLTLLSPTVYGQVDCGRSLHQAELAYSLGKFGEVHDLLRPCLGTRFNKEEKIQGYRLMALSYIFEKDFQRADSALHSMLKINPQYEISPQDPPELLNRIKKFKIHPILEIGGGLGLIMPFYHVTDVYNSRIIDNQLTYKGKVGTQGGLFVAYYFSRRFSLRAGYEFQRYSLIIEDKNSLNTGELTESQSRAQWQAAIGYLFRLRKVNLQTYVGAVFNTLKKADANFVMRREDGSDDVVYFSNYDSREVKEVRPMAEVKLNIPSKNKWTAYFSVRYELGLQNQTNGANRFNNLDRIASFEWVEDDFKASYVSASVGISRRIYQVKMK